ncbi:DUF4342 domain-containing protein [bacterium]|nr:MAG: DUF4342 domain-containing protein [bacterium]
MSNSIFEEITVTGKELLETIKSIVSDGNVRRIVVKNKKGKILIEIPLTVGVAGLGAAIYVLGAFIPAITFYALFANDFSILIERDGEGNKKEVEAEAQIIKIVEDEGPKKDDEKKD